MITLYRAPVSSAVRRVQIALRLKGLDWREEIFELADAKRDPTYLRRNPQGKVPSLADGELSLTQSLAILEYLDEAYPEPALLPREPARRAKARAIAQVVACEVHPLQNMWVGRWLAANWDVAEPANVAWRRHWIRLGLEAVEGMLGDGPFCLGETPTIADCCVVPQVANAHGYGVDLAGCPRLLAVEARCLTVPAFRPD